MDENIISGNLVENPFPEVLVGLRQKEKSGYLALQIHTDTRTLYFDRGRIAAEKDAFPQKRFLDDLRDHGVLSAEQAGLCAARAKENGTSILKAMIGLGLIPAADLWRLMAEFVKEDVYPLFDLDFGSYSFCSARPSSDTHLLFTIPMTDIVLEGIRRMENHRIIEDNLPPEDATLQVLAASSRDLAGLEPHETYILNEIRSSCRLGELYATSELGKKDSQKVVYALITLGIAGTAQNKPATRALVEAAAPDYEKLMSAFNDKCSYLFKYVAKELGPVALSILEKSLDECRPRLGPLFQGAGIRSDGRIDIRPAAKISLNFHLEEHRRGLVRNLNEILAAEVLAVKRTLGNSHEAAVVRNLEKIGECV